MFDTVGVLCAGFWVPEGAESGSSEEGEGEEDDDQEEGSDAAGSSEGGDLDMEAAAGPTDSEGELTMCISQSHCITVAHLAWQCAA